MNRLTKISGIQPNIHLNNKNDSPNVTCPICFIEFSPSHIQLHASNCKGEPKKSLVSEEITTNEKQLDKVGSVEKSSKKAMISSFFKSESQGKRSLPDNNPSVTYNSPKKYKSVEQHNINKVEPNNEKNCVRRPLADVMRPTALEHYKGQEDIVGVSKNGFWRPIFQSISKQCKDVAFPSMIFWVRNLLIFELPARFRLYRAVLLSIAPTSYLSFSLGSSWLWQDEPCQYIIIRDI